MGDVTLTMSIVAFVNFLAVYYEEFLKCPDNYNDIPYPFAR